MMRSQAIVCVPRAKSLVVFAWGLTQVGSGRHNAFSKIVGTHCARYIEERERPHKEREAKVRAMRLDQHARALIKAKAERQLLKEAALEKEDKVKEMRRNQQQRALTRALAQRKVKADGIQSMERALTETPPGDEATGPSIVSIVTREATSESDKATKSMPSHVTTLTAPARTSRKPPKVKRGPPPVNLITATTVILVRIPFAPRPRVEGPILMYKTVPVETIAKDNFIKNAACLTAPTRKNKANAPAPSPSTISLPAVHVAAQACVNDTPATPCKRKVEPNVAASPPVAPAPGRPTTFAAMMQLLDAKAKAQAHSPAPSSESSATEFTGADIIGADAIGADAIVPSNNVRAPAVAAPADVAPLQVPAVVPGILGRYATPELMTLIETLDETTKGYVADTASLLGEILVRQDDDDFDATEKAFRVLNVQRWGWTLDTPGEDMCLMEDGMTSWATVEKQRRDIVVGMRYEHQPSLTLGLQDVGCQLAKAKVYRAQADACVHCCMDLLSALTSTARYSLANFNFKLRSGAEATGYSTSMFKEAALQNLLQFPNDPYTYYGVSLLDGPWMVARAYERKVLSTGEHIAHYTRCLSTPTRRVAEALRRLITLRPIPTWEKEELMLIKTLLRLLDMPHPELNPFGGPGFWLKREQPVLSGPDRWVHLAAGSIVSNESCLADWDKAENRLDGAREGRASGRYQPVGLRPDLTGLSPDARREQHEMHRALYLDQLTEWGELLDEVLDREMLQCELRTRLSWAFCTYVHHELRLSAVDQYASQRGLMRVDLELPFTHQLLGVTSPCATSDSFKLNMKMILNIHPDLNAANGARARELTQFLIGCKEAMQKPSFRVAIEEIVYEGLDLGLQQQEVH